MRLATRGRFLRGTAFYQAKYRRCGGWGGGKMSPYTEGNEATRKMLRSPAALVRGKLAVRKGTKDEESIREGGLRQILRKREVHLQEGLHCVLSEEKRKMESRLSQRRNRTAVVPRGGPGGKRMGRTNFTLATEKVRKRPHSAPFIRRETF